MRATWRSCSRTCDAAMGDYTQALHALDSAAALTGGVLPAEWGRRRDEWLAHLAASGS